MKRAFAMALAILLAPSTVLALGPAFWGESFTPPAGGGSIAWGGVGDAADLSQDSGTNPFVIDMPGSVTSGGLAIAFAVMTHANTASVTTGWTLEETATDAWASHDIYIFSHATTGSEPSSYSFPTTGTAAMKGAIIWFSDGTSVDDIQCNTSNGTGATSLPAPNVTPTEASGMIVSVVGYGANLFGAVSITDIPGDDRLTSNASGPYVGMLAIGTTASSGTSPQGAANFTASTSTYYIACTLALH